MLIHIVVIYDTTSYEADERVEIEEVFSSYEKAEKYAKNLILNSCQDYDIKKYEIREE